jgi:hypothetical protein
MSSLPTEDLLKPPLSLREILALTGVESNYETDRRKVRRQFAARLEVELGVAVPGIKVSYLDLDASVWEQVAHAVN